MGFKIGLLGLGTVGTGTVQILLDPLQRHPLVQELELYRVGVRSPAKPRAVDLPSHFITTDLEAIVTDPDIDIVVEVMGGLEPARSLMLMAIAHGKHVVTANKAAIARYGAEIFTAAEKTGVYVLLEAAVGGGIPVIEPLKQSLCANRLHTVTGIINGTTNYILTRMQTEGGNFADILADAQRLGYAEADPTADVDGLDAADKIAILASLAFGGRIKLPDVHCEGIRQVSAADIAYAEKLGFVIKLLAVAKREDAAIAAPETPVLQLRVHPTLVPKSHPLASVSAADIAYAEKLGFVIKLLAVAKREDAAIAAPETPVLQLRVHPTLVPKSHPLASVNGVYNAIVIEGEPIGQVMFFGPGAGAGPTASAVVADILNIAAILKVEQGSAKRSDGLPLLDPLLACSHQDYCTIAPMSELVTRFYVRFLTQDSPGVIGKLGTCFGNHNVSLESIVQTGLRDDLAEIVVVTHHVREGNFRTALDEIRAMASVSSIASTLRVL